MKDIQIAVTGRVATPAVSRVVSGDVPVTSFRLACTPRRFDRSSKVWVDQPTTWLTVTCWRQLARNVEKCVEVGQMVVVSGRLLTPTWDSSDGSGIRRTRTELEADSVGLDLTYGTVTFAKNAAGVRPVWQEEVDELAERVEAYGDGYAEGLEGEGELGGDPDADGAAIFGDGFEETGREIDLEAFEPAR